MGSDNIIHLDELRLATKIVREVPGIIKNIDKSIDLLYTYNEYQDIYVILEQLHESKIMLQLTLEVYTQVLKDLNG